MANLLRFLQAAFPASVQASAGVWQPPADIYRTTTGWLVKLDLAGVQPEDVEVLVQGSTLTVRGIRRDWSLEESCHCYQMEIAYSHFERHINFPENLQQATVTAEHRLGMLLVRILSGGRPNA
jgi:HSP20 family protein